MPSSESQPKYEVTIARDVMVAMRDGVRLATDIYFPASNGEPIDARMPSLLHRTPYDKSVTEETLAYCRYFAQRGYVAVIQDCRGTFASEGDVDFLFPEAEDGFDTLGWIDRQP